jgi:nickel/cobalt transporter (NicO) family protein
MSRRSRLVTGCGVVAAVVLWPAVASAHPLGNFTVNVYDGIHLSPRTVRVIHVVDMAEIPTFQELRRLDEGGRPSAAELSAWASLASRNAQRELWVTAEGRPVTLSLASASASLRRGQGGLPTLRLEAEYAGSLPTDGTLRFQDGTFSGRLGWREITASGAAGITLRSASVPTGSISDALRSYPQNLLSSPPRVTSASVSFEAGIPSAGERAPPTAAALRDEVSGARTELIGGSFAELATRGPLTPPLLALSLILALGFGAVHAIGPGHGKIVMAAYLVSVGGRIRHAVAVAVAVAAMHTVSVVGLGVLVLTIERAFPAEIVYPWLGLVSGAATVALGLGLLVARLASRRRDDHPHDHLTIERPFSGRGLATLAFSGGLLPSSTAMVALLASIALGRAAFGMALVGAFSLGLAAALCAVGLLAVRARTGLAPRLGGWARLLPLGSASVIAVMGAVVVTRAAMQL